MAAEARALDDLSLTIPRPVAPRRARLRSVPPPASLAAAELAELPARLIASLPLPFTARLRASDGTVFFVTTSEAERTALTEVGAIALDGREWEALAIAADADRVWPGDLVAALRGRGVTGRLELTELLGGVEHDASFDLEGLHLDGALREVGAGGVGATSVGRVLARVGARIEDVRAADDRLASFP